MVSESFGPEMQKIPIAAHMGVLMSWWDMMRGLDFYRLNSSQPNAGIALFRNNARIASFPNLKPSTKTISLRPQQLLDAIKTAANARDVPYQSLIKVRLQEKVRRS